MRGSCAFASSIMVPSSTTVRCSKTVVRVGVLCIFGPSVSNNEQLWISLEIPRGWLPCNVGSMIPCFNFNNRIVRPPPVAEYRRIENTSKR